MNISQDTKLDFSDVLLTPAWSISASRSDVNMERVFNGFYHSDREWSGLPIMIANMDTTGTIEMWEHVSCADAVVCFDKRKSFEYWEDLRTDWWEASERCSCICENSVSQHGMGKHRHNRSRPRQHAGTKRLL